MSASEVPEYYRAQFNNFFRQHPGFGIRLTRHARERMRERDIGSAQIRSVLRSGQLRHVEIDIRSRQEKYRVVGADVDGRSLEVVANLKDTGAGRVIVITVIDSS